MNCIRNFAFKYIHPQWNIAIAEKDASLNLHNIQWLKHPYHDRWFADPFIINETDTTFIILVEEFLRSTRRGRIAELEVRKNDLKLINNKTILDISSHLSFPNYITIGDVLLVYPENGAAGNLKIYKYEETLKYFGTLSSDSLADPVIVKIGADFVLFATHKDNCNGHELLIYKSDSPTQSFNSFQKIEFTDNIARRAGRPFMNNGALVCPAQVCNSDYGEGISFQVLEETNGIINMTEVKRMFPPTSEYPDGFHTYNVYKNNLVVIDGYKYRCRFLHNLYKKIFKH